ncbi:hypothetical protein EJ08DRAFT_731302 [Tothia fuscella]|uniref:Translation machinery-associated protein 16 n=1 Tax=Tothia fuscella TaxID=1048955 RepID=A0A9P4NYZ9_9PEZI|nr:hypothetical protein EJ08DRAFT_731302 [Tothia fuscella]
MPVKALHKVQKHIIKKKGKNASIHEHSRDSKRLQRASGREDKIAKVISARQKVNRPHLHRVAFLQTATADRTEPLQLPEIQDLIGLYIHRLESKLDDLNAERRPGRPASTGEVTLKQQRDRDVQEYDAGFWIPDLQDVKVLETLKGWGGEWVSLNTMKFVRIAKDGTRLESSFPPKGQS